MKFAERWKQIRNKTPRYHFSHQTSVQIHTFNWEDCDQGTSAQDSHKSWSMLAVPRKFHLSASAKTQDYSQDRAGNKMMRPPLMNWICVLVTAFFSYTAGKLQRKRIWESSAFMVKRIFFLSNPPCFQWMSWLAFQRQTGPAFQPVKTMGTALTERESGPALACQDSPETRVRLVGVSYTDWSRDKRNKVCCFGKQVCIWSVTDACVC